jgi:alpha-glucoside transport system permease protein
MATAAVERRAEPVVIEEGMGPKILRVLGRAPVHVVLVLIGIFWLIPTTGLFITSLLDPAEAAQGGWWTFFSKPSQWTFENYSNMFDDEGITDALIVTAQVTIGATILPIIVAALAGYALAWIEFPGRDVVTLGVVALLVVPVQVALVPVAKLLGGIGLYGSIPGVVAFHVAFGMPFAVFLLRNSFVGIPRDLLEAARLDGGREFRIFWRLVLPISRPAVAALATFQFLWVWNDLLVALVFADEGSAPITVALRSQLRQFGSNVDVLASGAFVSMIVPLVVFFAFQRAFVQGVLAGSTK